MPLQCWDLVAWCPLFLRASLLPKQWFLSHEYVCAAGLLGLCCHQLALSKGYLLLAFPAQCWPAFLFTLLWSLYQGAWKEKWKLQSCWFLMGMQLWMLLADSSRSRQVCAVQLLVQMITASAMPATVGLCLTSSRSTPSMLTSHGGCSLPTKREGNITAASPPCSVSPENTPSTWEPLHHCPAAGLGISLVTARSGTAQILGE